MEIDRDECIVILKNVQRRGWSANEQPIGFKSLEVTFQFDKAEGISHPKHQNHEKGSDSKIVI